jgi:ribosomal protein L29
MQSKVDELHSARFKHALGQLSETHSLKTLRRDIARLQTILNERSREQA